MPRFVLRPPGPTFGAALSRHPERAALEPRLAAGQHAAFVAALRDAGCALLELPADAVLPDATFVADCVVPLERGGGLVVVTRPGAPSRRDEVVSVADAVRSWAPSLRLARIEAPGTLEGGDVLVVGTTIAIGLSERTNEDGARQLAAFAAALGYRSRLCPVEDRLHLASEVSAIGGQRLIGTGQGFASLRRSRPVGDETRDWLTGVTMIEVPASESPAANVLAIDGTCVMAAGFPAARAALEAAGVKVVEVELGQFTRADGGPTCLVALVPGEDGAADAGSAR